MADPKLTPDVPWPDDHVQLTTAEAKLAVLLGDHPGGSSFRTDTALVDLLDRGLAVCARAPNRHLIFKPSMASDATELDPRLVGEMKLQPAVRGREREQLQQRLAELRAEEAVIDERRAALQAQIDGAREFLKGGEHEQEAQEAAPITETGT